MAPPKVHPPIIGSFEDIGKDVVHEIAKAPTDIAGKVLESLTGGSSVKGQKQAASGAGDAGTKKPDGALGAMEQTDDKNVKKAIARAALEQLAGRQEQKPSSVFEEKQKEEQQKKQMEQEQAKKAAFAEMPKMSSKKRRGDLYGIKGKSSTEMSKNVRQD